MKEILGSMTNETLNKKCYKVMWCFLMSVWQTRRWFFCHELWEYWDWI